LSIGVDTNLIVIVIKTALNISATAQTINYLLNRQERMFISMHDEKKWLNMQKDK